MTRQEQQEKFFRAIGYVGDDLIQRADVPVERKTVNTTWVKWAALAACCVLVIGLALDARRAFAYKNKPAEICLANEKHRWVVYYVLVICLLIGYIMQSGGFGGASGFGMYANF